MIKKEKVINILTLVFTLIIVGSLIFICVLYIFDVTSELENNLEWSSMVEVEIANIDEIFGVIFCASLVSLLIYNILLIISSKGVYKKNVINTGILFIILLLRILYVIGIFNFRVMEVIAWIIIIFQILVIIYFLLEIIKYRRNILSNIICIVTIIIVFIMCNSEVYFIPLFIGILILDILKIYHLKKNDEKN